MLESFAAWLGGTPLTAFLENQSWAVPTVQIFHILAITVVVGAATIVNLRIVGVIERGQSIAALTARFAAPSIVALAVLAATGFLLIAAEPTRAIFRYLFWAKMALLLAAVGLTAGLLAGLKEGGGAFSDPAARVAAPYRLVAVLILLLWAAIIVAGRWIGYAEGWPGSPQ